MAFSHKTKKDKKELFLFFGNDSNEVETQNHPKNIKHKALNQAIMRSQTFSIYFVCCSTEAVTAFCYRILTTIHCFKKHCNKSFYVCHFFQNDRNSIQFSVFEIFDIFHFKIFSIDIGFKLYDRLFCKLHALAFSIVFI